MKQIVAEQLTYGIDGFHIDMLDQGCGKPYGCWCDSCHKSFNERFGHEMPNPTPRTTPQKNRPYILPGLIEDVPIFRVKVATAAGILDVNALNQNTQVRSLDRHIQATIEDIHDVLIVDY